MAQARAGFDAKAVDQALKDLTDESLGLACSLCLALPSNAVHVPSGSSVCAACAKTKNAKDPFNRAVTLTDANTKPNLWVRTATPLIQGLVEALAAERAAKAARAAPSAQPQLAEYQQTLAATVAELERLRKNQAPIDAERLQHQLTLKALNDEKANNAALAQARAAEHKAEAQRLHDTLMQERANYRATAERLTSMEAIARQQQQKADQLIIERSRLHKSLEASSRFETVYRDLERQYLEHTAQYQTVVAHLKTQNATLKAENAFLITAQKTELARVQEEAQTLRMARQQLDRLIEHAQQKLQESETARAAAETQVKQLTANNSFLQSEVDVLRLTTEELTTQISGLKSRLTCERLAGEASNLNLQRAQSETNARVEKLTTELATAKAEIARLQQELDARPARAATVHSRRSSTPSPATAASHYQAKRGRVGRLQLLSAQRAALAAGMDAPAAAADTKSDKTKSASLSSAASDGAAAAATVVPGTQHRASLPDAYGMAALHTSGMHKRNSAGSLAAHDYSAREKEANRLIGTKLNLNTILHLAPTAASEEIDISVANKTIAELKTQLTKLGNGMSLSQHQQFAQYIQTRLQENFKSQGKENAFPHIIEDICKAIDPNFVLAAKPQCKFH